MRISLLFIIEILRTIIKLLNTLSSLFIFECFYLLIYIPHHFFFILHYSLSSLLFLLQSYLLEILLIILIISIEHHIACVYFERLPIYKFYKKKGIYLRRVISTWLKYRSDRFWLEMLKGKLISYVL